MNKLHAMKQIHGQVIQNSSDIEDSLDNCKDSHKISLASQYQDKIGSMTLDELQSLAEELGLIPVDNRDTLIKSIRKEFKKK